MTLTTTTHLNFPGTAREALDFYQSVFGGRVLITSYGELGMPPEAPDAGNVVFGSLEADSGFRIMGYDIPGRTEPFEHTTRREQGLTFTDQPVFISLSCETLDEATAYWDRLGVGGAIVEELAASAWSAGFGMLTDRYGVTWTVGVAADPR